MKLKVHKGIMQDGTFITADPGYAKADTPRGDEAKTRRSMERGQRKEPNPFSATSCMMP
jgi:IS5 family transposase